MHENASHIMIRRKILCLTSKFPSAIYAAIFCDCSGEICSKSVIIKKKIKEEEEGANKYYGKKLPDAAWR
jgi:hypothetical protein